jgi:two-component system, cell cycle sensor histidine kinase and response regulator CckA
MRSEHTNEQFPKPMLSRLGLLDQPDDPTFDRLAKLAARLLGAPIGLVTLAGSDQLYLTGLYGLGEPWRSSRTLPLAHTPCQQVLVSREPLAVGNTTTDPLTCESAVIAEIGAAAYLGLPLRAPDHTSLGTICVLDDRPRQWDAEDIAALSDLAAMVETAISMRQTLIDHAHTNQYQIAQRSAFDQIAAGTPLDQILSTLARGIESQIEGARCAIMLLDASRQHLNTGAAPSLPPVYCRMIDGSRIGPRAGSCGTAVFLGRPVVVADIAADPLWVPWRSLALSHGLHACWSIPVFDSAGQTLGAFAIYYSAARRPSDAEFDLVLGTARVVAVAVERWRTIDALRSSEARLRRSEANLAAVFEHTDDAIWSVDTNLRVVTINGRAVARLRVMTGALVSVGAIFDADMPDSQRIFWRRLYRRALSGERFSIEQPYIEGGSQRWCEISLNPIYVDESIGGVSVFNRDLTERKRAEADRLAMERSWQETQRLESLGLLAGGIAHDFNNLLATILGNTELALLDTHEQAPIRESLEQIELAARRAAEMTQQILAYAGKGRVALEPISVNELVREMAALLRGTLLRQVPITYLLGADLPAVEGDTAQLRQVVMNVIVNAAEAISGGPGVIEVCSELRSINTQSGEGFDPCPTPGTYVCLEVRDSGPGMSRPTMARIFEPFFTTKFTGRGLGLAAVQGIVRSHRGALRVESTLGEGTTFTVLLPTLSVAAEQSPNPPKQHPDQINPRQESGLILVVDDEPTVLQLTGRLLRRLGYSPLEASSYDAAQALLQLHRTEVRCILLDWTMPGRSGDAALRSLRSLSQQTPIIVMSGYSEQVLAETTPETRPTGFLHKPFNSEALQYAIAQATAAEA